MFASVCKEI